jgi:putative transposase
VAAVRDGMSRTAAAAIGAMDRQTLRDWGVSLQCAGTGKLINTKAPGPLPKLARTEAAFSTSAECRSSADMVAR